MRLIAINFFNTFYCYFILYN